MHRALREFDRLSPGTPPDPRSLQRLRFGWGNEQWAAEAPFLAAIATAIEQTNGTVVEAGSGLSTVLISRLLNPRRAQLALEHDPLWMNRVNRACHHRDPVIHSPIVSHGEWDWYTVPGHLRAGSVGLLVCDGPPSTTRGGRYGALPLLRDHLADDAIVLVDDAGREAETRMIKQWESEFGMRFERSNASERTFAIGRFT